MIDLQRYPENIQNKIRVITSDTGNVEEVETQFGSPYLDVVITRTEDGFICSFSNENYSEHWYKKDVKNIKIESDMSEVLRQLITKGAIQKDKYTEDNVLLSSNLQIGDIIDVTGGKKIRLFARKSIKYMHYPPVIDQQN